MFFHKIRGFILCLIILLAIGCSEVSEVLDGVDDSVSVSPGDIPSADTQLWGDVVIIDTDTNVDEWVNDTYELNSAEITDDTLRISVSYGGGCEEHEFTLIASNAFMESDPVQLNISIVHNANLDPCERWVSESYHFDLTPLKDLYLQKYPPMLDASDPEPAAIVLKITDSLEDTLDLLYRF